jgi:hypothetical protein
MMATIVRDFMVVEERESSFGVRAKGVRRNKRGPASEKLNIIYLPRVHYVNPKPANYLDAMPYREVARHSVRPHLRKSSHASKEQLWLAHRYNMGVPTGYTFVRPHKRGGSDEKSKAIYRSRSASRLLYEVIDDSVTKDVAWFQFERDVQAFMKAKGYRVEHLSASKNGDGGVDVYAYEPDGDEIWAIQCKCYSPSHKIGPAVVRDLKGALHKYPEGTKGMIVTTSTFTAGAVEEAKLLGIELVDGVAFARGAVLAPHTSS